MLPSVSMVVMKSLRDLLRTDTVTAVRSGLAARRVLRTYFDAGSASKPRNSLVQVAPAVMKP